MSRIRLAGLVFALSVATAPVIAGGNPIDFVEPAMGSWIDNTIIGPHVPHASIHASPQTLDVFDDWQLAPWNDGYNPNTDVSGFAHLHAQGTGGIASYGQLLLSISDGLVVDEAALASPTSGEVAKLDYYRVTLEDSGIECELTPAHHSVLYRFTFPSGSDPVLVLNAGRKIRGPESMTDGTVSIAADGLSLTGSGHYVGNWRGAAFDLNYVLEVSEPPVAVGTFEDGVIQEGDRTRSRVATDPTASFGAYLRFPPGTKELHVRLAISFRDVDTAVGWMRDELPDWDFGAARDRAAAAWDDDLSRVRVFGGDDETTRLFYTTLSKVFTQPRDRTGDVPLTDGDFLDDHYTMWDTYRTLWPLMSLVKPALTRRALLTFSELHARDGFVGTAVVAGVNIPAPEQGGTEVDNIVADALVRDVPFGDPESLFRIVEENAVHRRTGSYFTLGYDTESPNPASTTLAFCLNDLAAAIVAERAGRPDPARAWRSRAANWETLWSPEVSDDAFDGFVLPRSTTGTTIGEPRSLLGFYEESSWSYSFNVPHMISEVVTRMGGPDRFVERIRHGIEQELIDDHNEPHILPRWLPHYGGQPHVSADLVRELSTRYTAVRYPGQEDAGCWSSVYVWSAIGLFPMVAQPVYLLTPPFFPRVEMVVGEGARFSITAAGADRGANLYIQSATLNGEPLSRSWLVHDELVAGGALDLVLGPNPGDWARGLAPPSPDSGSPAPLTIDVAHPNPFTSIVTVASVSPITTAGIYDVAGRLVRELTAVPAGGAWRVRWSGTDARGEAAPAGVYFLSIGSGGERNSHRVVKLR